MTSEMAIVLPAGGGETAPDPLGRPRVVKASPSSTDGAYTLTEATLPPGLGAPSHVHIAHEEAFYVLEGEMTFAVEKETVVAGAGDFILVPRATRHGFDVTGDEPAKYLCIFCIFSPPITDAERESLVRQIRESNRSAS